MILEDARTRCIDRVLRRFHTDTYREQLSCYVTRNISGLCCLTLVAFVDTISE